MFKVFGWQCALEQQSDYGNNSNIFKKKMPS